MNENQVETTGYSISAAAPAQPERRSDERFVRLLRVGAIVVDGRRELCLIRNISAGGLMIRAYSEIPIGAAVSVEFKQGKPVSGIVHWAKDGLTGIGFDAPIDVLSLLAPSGGGPRPRLPRIDMECMAWVRQESALIRVRATNVSQGGIGIVSQQPLVVGGDVVVTLPGLTPAAGVVAWSSGESYGISFNRALVLSELVDWLQEQQQQEQHARLAS
ncbi:MAG TPA: PilZ domain-containing protein [Sphingomicrobium sp.]|jgi:hypothetical protein